MKKMKKIEENTSQRGGLSKGGDEGSSTPKIAYAQSRFRLRSSNRCMENEKKTASADLK